MKERKIISKRFEALCKSKNFKSKFDGNLNEVVNILGKSQCYIN